MRPALPAKGLKGDANCGMIRHDPKAGRKGLSRRVRCGRTARSSCLQRQDCGRTPRFGPQRHRRHKRALY